MNVYFNNIENTIIDQIRTCERSLKIASAWFTNQSIAIAIIEHKNIFINIEIIVADNNYNKISTALKRIHQIRSCRLMEIGGFDKGGMMHHKFCIIDDKKVLTGSYNYTENANNNFEDLNIIEDIMVVKKYVKRFNELKVVYEQNLIYGKLININREEINAEHIVNSEIKSKLRQSIFYAIDNDDADFIINIDRIGEYEITTQIKMQLINEYFSIRQESLKGMTDAEQMKKTLKKIQAITSIRQALMSKTGMVYRN